MRVAALDLGSNTFLCLIADIERQGKITVVSDLAEVVRLGQGLAATGEFAQEALERAARCLARFKAEIGKHHPERVLAVATAAARSAKNQKNLVQLLEQLDIPLEIISGQREAELTYAGAISGLQTSQQKVVIDIGGGSTELIVGSAGKILYKKSFEVGVVKLREKFVTEFPIPVKTQKLIGEELDAIFNEATMIEGSVDLEVIAVAGTPTTLAAAALGGFDANKVDGFRFSVDQLLQWQASLAQLTPEQIEEKFSVPKGRSDVLAVGVMILVTILKAIKHDHLTVSIRGLRYGTALELSSRGMADGK